jgi:hypothetical protein
VRTKIVTAVIGALALLCAACGDEPKATIATTAPPARATQPAPASTTPTTTTTTTAGAATTTSTAAAPTPPPPEISEDAQRLYNMVHDAFYSDRGEQIMTRFGASRGKISPESTLHDMFGVRKVYVREGAGETNTIPCATDNQLVGVMITDSMEDVKYSVTGVASMQSLAAFEERDGSDYGFVIADCIDGMFGERELYSTGDSSSNVSSNG